MTEPTVRVCPRCGSDAGEQQYCQTCGLHLTQQPELPTRAQWEESQADDAGRKQDPLTPVLRQWLAGRRRGRIALVATACLAIFGIGLVAVTVGGGDSDADPAEPVQEFLDAVVAGDGARACDQLTREQERSLGEDFSTVAGVGISCARGLSQLDFDRLRDVEIEQVEVDGDRALVKTTNGAEVQLDRIGDDWLIADISSIFSE